MSDGMEIEVEELGRVALISVLLVPGILWIANGNGAAARVRRSMVLGGLIAAASGLEAILDSRANDIVDAVD
jgi:hypothetical protein